MEIITQLFGKEDNLTTFQMCARGAIVFITVLIIVQTGSIRTFGKASTMDHVLVIMLGGILSRVITSRSICAGNGNHLNYYNNSPVTCLDLHV